MLLSRLAYGVLALLVNVTVVSAGEPVTLLALGDSLTAGYGLAQGKSFPAQLERALNAKGYDVEVVNSGVSGDTSAGGLSRLDWALADDPEAAIVELGANDGLRGLPPDATFDNLDALLARLRQAGVAVLLTGMRAPPNLGRSYTEEFDAIYPRLADKHEVLFYPFFLAGVAAEPHLNQDDGIHPTAEGVAVIVENMLPYVERLIARATGGQPTEATEPTEGTE